MQAPTPQPFELPPGMPVAFWIDMFDRVLDGPGRLIDIDTVLAVPGNEEPLQHMNASIASVHASEKCARRIRHQQNYLHRLDGYTARGVLPWSMLDPSDLASETQRVSTEIERLQRISTDIARWKTAAAVIHVNATREIEFILSGIASETWARGDVPVLPSWWPTTGVLRPDDARLFTKSDWLEFAFQQMMRACRYGIDLAADAPSLRSELITRRGASTSIGYRRSGL